MPDNERLELEKIRRALDMEEIEKPVIKYKVKRRWWTWLLGIIFNIIAIRCLFTPAYILSYIIFFVDIVIVFPEISHTYYMIENGNFIVKRIIYSNIVIPCHKVTMVENATLLTFAGYRLKIWDYSLGAYKITYMANSRRLTVIITPKNREKFMKELASYLGKDVVLLDSIESAFKQQKK